MGLDGLGRDVVDWDEIRALLSVRSGPGLLARTARGTYAQRRIQAGDGITVSQGDGVAGDPSIAVDGTVSRGGHTHTLADITDEGALAALNVGGGLEQAGANLQRSALTGDVTAAAGGSATTIANDAVSDAKLRNSAALSVIGRAVNSVGDPADIAATAASGAVLRESGSALGFGTVATAGLADAAVTYAKIQDVSATDKVLGRATAGAGDVEEITCTAAGRALLDDADAAAQRTTLGLGAIATEGVPLAIAKGGTGQTAAVAAFDALAPGTTKGDVLVHNGTYHVRLGVGADGQILKADSTKAEGLKWAAEAAASGAESADELDVEPPFDHAQHVLDWLMARIAKLEDGGPVAAGIAAAASLELGDLADGLGRDTVPWSELLAALARPPKGALLASLGGLWRQLSVGSNGQVLTADSTEVSGLKWAAAGGSATLVDLASATASSSATIDLEAFSDTYREYLVFGSQVKPAIDNNGIFLRVKDGTYQGDAGDYSYDRAYIAGGTWTLASSDSASVIAPMDGIGNATGEGVSFVCLISRPRDAENGFFRVLMLWCGTDTAGNSILGYGGGQYDTQGANITGFRIFFAAGNIASGEFSLYGVSGT